MDVLHEAHATPQRLSEVPLSAREIFASDRVIKLSCIRVIDGHHVKLDEVHHKDHVDIHDALSRVDIVMIIRDCQEARPTPYCHRIRGDLSLKESHQQIVYKDASNVNYKVKPIEVETNY